MSSEEPSTTWCEQVPYVQAFQSMEGLANYAKTYHLPNVYDRLCFMQTASDCQKVLQEHFKSIETTGYLSILWLLVFEYPPRDDGLFTYSSHSEIVVVIERYCQNDKKIVDEFAERAKEWYEKWNARANLQLIWPVGDQPTQFSEQYKYRIRQ